MNCEHAVEIFSLLTLFLGIASGALLKECYAAEFSEDVWSCPDFDNQNMKCDTLRLGMVEGKEGELGLNGDIELNKAIEEGMEIAVDVWKVLDIGNEFLYHTKADICANIKDKSTPWYPIVESMKTDKCPIDANTYSIKDMVLRIGDYEDIMTHEMTGEYLLGLSLMKNLTEKMSCHQFVITVSSYEC